MIPNSIPNREKRYHIDCKICDSSYCAQCYNSTSTTFQHTLKQICVIAVCIIANGAARIIVFNRIIPTIGKHIITKDTLAGRREGISIYKSTDLGIIISAPEIIQPGFSVVALAPVPTCFAAGCDQFLILDIIKRKIPYEPFRVSE